MQFYSQTQMVNKMTVDIENNHLLKILIIFVLLPEMKSHKNVLNVSYYIQVNDTIATESLR